MFTVRMKFFFGGGGGIILLGCLLLHAAIVQSAVIDEKTLYDIGVARSPFENTNVILLTLQCLRPDHTGFGGYKRDTTPQLDQLSKSTVIFDSAISQANLTPPAMMSVLTSQYPRVNGLVSFDVTKESVRARTMPEILKMYGYKTAAVVSSPEFFMRFDTESGKSINLRDVFSRSFDDYITTQRMSGGTTVRMLPRKALDWIEKNKDKKFFLWIASGVIHPPYAASVPMPDKAIYDPPGYTPFWTKYFPITGNEGGAEDPTIDMLMRLWRGDYYQGFTPVHHLESDDAAYITGRYDAGVRYTDEFVGELVDKLENAGLLNNTILIITSVHGKALGERATYINYDVQESVLKNVLLIRFPNGQYAGRRISEQVQGIDILPTLLNYLDIPIAFDQQGMNLMPLIRGESGAKGSEYVYIDRTPLWEHWMSRHFLDYKFHDPNTANHPPSEDKAIVDYEKMLRNEFPLESYPPGDIAIRTNRWKMIVRKNPRQLEKVSWFNFLSGKKTHVDDEELYDLVSDPLEIHNVVSEYPKVAKELKEKLMKWDSDVESKKAPYHNAGEKRYVIPYP